jgi:hypothetical protein
MLIRNPRVLHLRHTGEETIAEWRLGSGIDLIIGGGHTMIGP